MKNQIYKSIYSGVKPFIVATSFVTTSLMVIGCGGGDSSSFSLLADSDTFRQSSGTVNSKVDILWMIDNSGSMQSSQEAVANNLSSFIQDFQSKNLDYKMAIATSDAYRTIFNNNQNCSRFRDRILNGSCNTVSGYPSSGYRIIDTLTPNLQTVFSINTAQTDDNNNVYGSGDERAFQSIKAAMNQSLNAGFLRDDSFFAIIIISDEDDFSHDGSSMNENYSYSGLHSIASYVNYLDTLTASGGGHRRYSVNGMMILDNACRTALGGGVRKVGVRYGQLIDAVNANLPADAKGIKSSLCGNFADDLKTIADSILTLSTRFKLARIPIPDTIVVTVNGSVVPKRDTNPLGNGGWVYEAATNEILFVGSAYIPPAGSSIKVDYDPVAYGQ